MQIREGRTHGRRAVTRKEANCKREATLEKTEQSWTCGKTGPSPAWCREGGKKNLRAIDEDETENVEETPNNDEELQAWCLLEERENEQWQEVISRRDEHKVLKANQASPFECGEVKIRAQRKSLK